MYVIQYLHIFISLCMKMMFHKTILKIEGSESQAVFFFSSFQLMCDNYSFDFVVWQMWLCSPDLILTHTVVGLSFNTIGTT